MHIIAPFLLLLVLVALLNRFSWNDGVEETPVTPASAPIVTRATPDIALLPTTELPPATATPRPSVTAQTVDQQPSTPETIQSVLILGPPDNSIFPSDGTVTFYWAWPTPLEDNYEFAIVFSQGTEQLAEATLSKTEMEHAYALEIPVGPDWPTGGDITWKIVLVDTGNQSKVAESPLRSFRLYVYNW